MSPFRNIIHKAFPGQTWTWVWFSTFMDTWVFEM